MKNNRKGTGKVIAALLLSVILLGSFFMAAPASADYIPQNPMEDIITVEIWDEVIDDVTYLHVTYYTKKPSDPGEVSISLEGDNYYGTAVHPDSDNKFYHKDSDSDILAINMDDYGFGTGDSISLYALASWSGNTDRAPNDGFYEYVFGTGNITDPVIFDDSGDGAAHNKGKITDKDVVIEDEVIDDHTVLHVTFYTKEESGTEIAGRVEDDEGNLYDATHPSDTNEFYVDIEYAGIKTTEDTILLAICTFWSGGEEIDIDRYPNVGYHEHTFSADPPAIDIEIVGSGTVVPDTQGQTYPFGTQVTLTATPASGWSFAGWRSGDITSLDNPLIITMNGNYSITAHFAEIGITYDLTVASSVDGSVNVPGEGTFTYDVGDVVNLVAVADVGYEFLNWTGDVTTVAEVDAASTIITVDANISVTATFTQELPPGDSAYDIKSDTVGELENAKGEDKRINQKIDKVIKLINASLNDKYWEDDSHLTKKGKKVFEEEKKAVKELMKIGKKDSSVSPAIGFLVEADRLLAQTAIDDAVAAGGDAKKIAKAEKEIANAQKDIDKGKYDKAIDHYRKAWEHAQKAT